MIHNSLKHGNVDEAKKNIEILIKLHQNELDKNQSLRKAKHRAMVATIAPQVLPYVLLILAGVVLSSIPVKPTDYLSPQMPEEVDIKLQNIFESFTAEFSSGRTGETHEGEVVASAKEVNFAVDIDSQNVQPVVDFTWEVLNNVFGAINAMDLSSQTQLFLGALCATYAASILMAGWYQRSTAASIVKGLRGTLPYVASGHEALHVAQEKLRGAYSGLEESLMSEFPHPDHGEKLLSINELIEMQGVITSLLNEQSAIVTPDELAANGGIAIAVSPGNDTPPAEGFSPDPSHHNSGRGVEMQAMQAMQAMV